MATGFGASVSAPLSAPVTQLKQSLKQQFEALEAPRVKRQPEHLLLDIVAIAILAVLGINLSRDRFTVPGIGAL